MIWGPHWPRPIRLEDYLSPPELRFPEFRFFPILSIPQIKHYFIDNDPEGTCSPPSGFGEVPDYIEYKILPSSITMSLNFDEDLDLRVLRLQRELELSGWLDHEPTSPGLGRHEVYSLAGALPTDTL